MMRVSRETSEIDVIERAESDFDDQFRLREPVESQSPEGKGDRRRTQMVKLKSDF